MDSGNDGKISYNIHSGNINNTFSIKHQTGEIVSTKLLDYETVSTYQLTVHATDQPSSGKDASKTAKTTLSISLLDVNDNAPQFNIDDSQSCRKFISDDTKFGLEAFSIKASDLDSDANAEMTYSVEPLDKGSEFLDLFSLESNSGVFTVKGDLSLDKSFPNGRELTFKYVARDSGTPSLSTEIQCSVLITGENKHAPRLDHPDVITVVTSSIYIGHQVTSIKASDADSGPDGTLQFSISAGDEDSVFKISEESGIVTLQKQPDHGYYSFKVEISDQASIDKRKSIFCFVHVYFSALPIQNIGNIVFGDAIENKKTFTVKKDEKLALPVYIQLGLHNLEGFDIEVTVVSGDIAEIDDVTSSQTQYGFFRSNSNKVRYLGLTDLTKNIFGFHQIGEITLLPISSGSVTVDIKIISMVSQELQDVKSGVSMDLESLKCNNVGSSNIISTCHLDMNDVTFIQSYLRQQAKGFIGSLGNKLQSISSSVLEAMDTDQNGALNNQDAQLLFNSLLGRTLTIKHVRLVQPGTFDEAKEMCDLLIEAKTSFNGLDGSTSKMDDFDVYLLLSHNTKELFEQAKSSNLKTLSSVSSSNIEGDMKYVEAVKMNGSTTTNNTYIFKLQTSAFHLKDIGLTLIVKNKKTLFTSSTMIKHSTSIDSDVTVISFDGIDVSLHARDRPQAKHNIETTSARCLNPYHTSRMRMKLDGDFDAHVAGKEEEFKNEFKIYLQTHLQKHGHTVIVSNIDVSKGSVVLDFDLQHEANAEGEIVSSLVDDLGNNQITMPFQGLDYPAQSTLKVDDQEKMVSPVREEENPMSKAFIAIGVIFGLVFIFGLIGVLYLCKKRDDPYQQTKEKKDDFERKLSDSSTSEINKFPTLVKHAKEAGVVNNAYEYFKTLDQSGSHTPNTKHVVSSLRKQPNLDMDQQTSAQPTAHAEQTRSSLRRRNTPKNLEEMQRELRVSLLFSSFV